MAQAVSETFTLETCKVDISAHWLNFTEMSQVLTV